jgi:hypothetical protein
MKRYLDKAQIKQLMDDFDRLLPKSDRPLLKNIISVLGNVFSLHIEEAQRQYFQQVIWKQIWNNEEKRNTLKQKRLVNGVVGEEVEKKFIKEFIQENCQKEWQYINSDRFKPAVLQSHFDNYTKANIVDNLSVTELLNTDDIRAYLEKKYGKQYLDKDCQVLTAKVKKNLDDFYQGIDYDTFVKISMVYLKSKDERILNNCLHSNTDDFMRNIMSL